MKKLFIILMGCLLAQTNAFACAYYEFSSAYFNLFTQHMISNKAYAPFLLNYDARFYEKLNDKQLEKLVKDKNIEEWQSYFNNELSYEQCKTLVYKVPMADLNDLKQQKTPAGNFAKQLPKGFYSRYTEGIDYLIEAKYLEPYMRKVGQIDHWSYYDKEETIKDASDMNYDHTVKALTSLYKAANNEQIKLRYGYQLVRFYHYNQKAEEAVAAFNTFVQPLQHNSEVYYLALDQYAGALRSIELEEEANWLFFQVFMHSNTRKKSAYISMKFCNYDSFEKLLTRVTNEEERIMAYFLLGYQNFNNPLHMMRKIAAINPNAEALMVLLARAINELEITYLPTNNPAFYPDKTPQTGRLPEIQKNYSYEIETANKAEKQMQKLMTFTEYYRNKTKDAFWDISYAYLLFLQKKYEESERILSNTQTNNREYQAEIKRMQMLNKLVKRPTIDQNFEADLAKNYKPYLFPNHNEVDYNISETSSFILDILANRYHLQGEDAKSFLTHNALESLIYTPNLDLTKQLEAFYHKTNKTAFENILAQKMTKIIKDPDSFFALVYGDFAMLDNQFEKAKSYYVKVKDGSGFIPTKYTEWDWKTEKTISGSYIELQQYDGFGQINHLIFGHNLMEHFNGKPEETMQAESFAPSFSFIKPQMNKIELCNTLIELQKIAKEGNKERASKANQLIGNMLYNTSRLGYFRHLFVMDINNGNNSNKFGFYNKSTTKPIRYYFKDYWYEHTNTPYRFDQALEYYNKALKQSSDNEQQAQILFQMASAEQGKYYVWEANEPQIDWETDNWNEKRAEQLKYFERTRQEKFQHYFDILKQDYRHTATAERLQSNCSYFKHFMAQ